MDLILGPFFDRAGAELTDEQLGLYERLLEENDQDLYLWYSGAAEPPKQHENILSFIRNRGAA